MPDKRLNTLEVKTLDEWRAWLARHHDSVPEVWLVFHKGAQQPPCIAYADALDEALCFGWIDSLVKRLDDKSYARKFTPRKADSRWSEINLKRYAELEADGRLKSPGLARRPTDRNYAPRPPMPAGVPPYIQDALDANPKASSCFGKLPPSERRKYLGWIDLAKQQETKERRLREAIALLAAGQKLGLK